MRSPLGPTNCILDCRVVLDAWHKTRRHNVVFLFFLVRAAKKRANVLDSDDFMDKTDDLENDFGSMAFSVVFTMFVRFLLTGHHPVDDDTDFDHTANQRMYMLIYACFALLVAAFATPYFAKKAGEAADANSYAKKRIWTF